MSPRIKEWLILISQLTIGFVGIPFFLFLTYFALPYNLLAIVMLWLLVRNLRKPERSKNVVKTAVIIFLLAYNLFEFWVSLNDMLYNDHLHAKYYDALVKSPKRKWQPVLQNQTSTIFYDVEKIPDTSQKDPSKPDSYLWVYWTDGTTHQSGITRYHVFCLAKTIQSPPGLTKYHNWWSIFLPWTRKQSDIENSLLGTDTWFKAACPETP